MLLAKSVILPMISFISLYSGLSKYSEPVHIESGYRIELDSKKIKSGNSSQIDHIAGVLAAYPEDHVSVQVYSDSEPIKDAEKIRDRLIEKGVPSGQISLRGEIQDLPEALPTTMWLEIRPTA